MRKSLILTAGLALMCTLNLAVAEPAVTAAPSAAEISFAEPALQCRAAADPFATPEPVASATLCELICAVQKASCDLQCGGDPTCLQLCELNYHLCRLLCVING